MRRHLASTSGTVKAADSSASVISAASTTPGEVAFISIDRSGVFRRFGLAAPDAHFAAAFPRFQSERDGTHSGCGLPRRSARSLTFFGRAAPAGRARDCRSPNRHPSAGRISSTTCVKQAGDHIWLVTFMHYDLGCFDDETCRFEPIDNPFGSKLLPMSPE